MREGSHFLFVDPSEEELLAVFRASAQSSAAGCTFPLWDSRYILPRGELAGPSLCEVSLGSVSTDKDVYRESDDTVAVLVVDLLRADEDVVAEVRLGAKSINRRTVHLDWNGMGVFSITDLVAGTYTVEVGQARTSFEVAGYQLAPASAVLLGSSFDGSQLGCTFQARTFGRPVTGKFRLAVLENGRPVHGPVEVESCEGLIKVDLPLQGTGPFVAHLSGVDDPGLDMQVPLRGTSRKERDRTFISRLGVEVVASALPLTGGRSCRGLWIRSEGANNAPFLLEDPVADVGALTARQSMEDVVLTILQVGERRAIHRFVGTVNRGRTLEFGVHPPLTLVAIGGLANGNPWESMAALLRPSEMGFTVKADARVKPRSNLSICLETARPQSAASVFLVVRDARLAPMDDPFTRLAAGLKAEIERACTPPVPRPASPASRQVAAVSAALEQLVRARSQRDARPPQPRATHPAPPSPRVQQALPEAPPATGPGRPRIRLGQALIDGGFIDQAQLGEALARQRRTGERLGQALIEMRVVTERDICELLSRQLAVPFIDLANYIIDPAIARLVPEHVSQRHQLIPINKVGNKLTVAMVDPLNVLALDDIQLMTGLQAKAVVATCTDVQRALQDTYGSQGHLDKMFTDICADVGPLDPLDDLERLCAERSRVPVTVATRVAPETAEPTLPASGPLELPVSDRLPEVLCAGLLHVKGRKEVSIPVGDTLGDLEVEAFALCRGDWERATQRVEVGRTRFVQFTLPERVHPSDSVEGRLDVGWETAPVDLVVTRDGQRVVLSTDGAELTPGSLPPSGRATLRFPAGPGEYRCTLTETSTGCVEQQTTEVLPPGRFRGLVRAIRVLLPGERVAPGDAGAVALRVMPGPVRILREISTVTAGYEHLCCEQTAAKILAALEGYLIARTDAERDRMESIALAGVERERKAWIRGVGLKAYADGAAMASPSLARTALVHLELAGLVGDRKGLPRQLRDGLKGLGEIVTDLGPVYRVKSHPTAPACMSEVYVAAAQLSMSTAQVVSFVDRHVAVSGREVQVAGAAGRVEARESACYAAAALLRLDEPHLIHKALSIVDWVGQQREAHGAYYSTRDSAAALTLASELAHHRLWTNGSGARSVKVNGRTEPVEKAVERSDAVEVLEAVDTPVIVEADQIREEDWTRFVSNLPVSVGLTRPREDRSVSAGDRLELRIEIPEYCDGDLAHVCLPPGLARLQGGGRVQSFSLDFQGSNRLVVPLVALQENPCSRRAFVCVRNMYSEERIGNPGEVVFPDS